ncbi:MAG: phosphoribosylformylglycinamidine synthase subunit PurQ / glutaminase [Thermotogaceae bacterium]|nr:phosphoribosylformylglycinamidine synthase subunit PurQ / glutaminase [Thermotogaceae bacterium]MDN5337475.1 phosphoribosylformylglycinamidine synthase subunit PurQ / glutaminase [Thermotogaceae bacterium]
MNSIRACVIVFPGTNCDRDTHFALSKIMDIPTDFVWHDFDEVLDYDIVVLPGGFSYGDYIRTGVFARFSPVMKSVEKYVLEERGLIIGICNGFQILTEAGLLPGALTRNTSTRFICDTVEINVENFQTPFTRSVTKKNLKLPIAHSDGNYRISEKELEKLKAQNRIVFRYVENPNGSVEDIAGVCSENFRILGMMPHPERAACSVLRNTDGVEIFKSMVDYLRSEKIARS